MKDQSPLPLPSHLAPPLHLLLLTVRDTTNPDVSAALDTAVGKNPDWDAFVETAARHSLSSLALRGLRRCSAAVPDAILERLRQQSMRAAGRALAQRSEIARIVPIFERAGIRLLLFKGTVLSQQLYGDPYARSANDIDILVGPAQLEAAHALLTAEGYRQAGHAYTAREFALHRRHIKDLEYVNKSAGVLLELHHRLSDNPHLLSCDFATLFSARTHVQINANRTATLPPDLLPLYLCVHGASHGWVRLIWLVDFAASLQNSTAEQALKAADRFGLRPLMLHGLLLAHFWLGTAPTQNNLEAARANRHVRALNRILAALMMRSFGNAAASTNRLDPREAWLARCYVYMAKRDWRYWRSQLVRELISPTDWEQLQLPERLFPLYSPYRLFGWLFRKRARRR
ncbi:MAG TPA: nucleotidyltransferase family protein [Xanthobacteraceae bacterium]|jgi:hypothetical protein|nr:nucleotidyltransferase family protein [Xanthobacteraceae bacterium]